MAIVPKNVRDQLQFYETHLAPFASQAEAIGITPEGAADLAMKAASARAAYRAQQAAQQAARSATLAFKNEARALRVAGAALLKQIHAKAQQMDSPLVYALAQIPVPAQGSPRPAPGHPTSLNVELSAGGALHLAWECRNPKGTSGTRYEIFRATIAAPYTFVYLGSVGVKTFVDESIPPGATRLIYRIRAVRSTKAGACAEFPVSFGREGSVGGTGGTVVAKVAA